MDSADVDQPPVWDAAPPPPPPPSEETVATGLPVEPRDGLFSQAPAPPGVIGGAVNTDTSTASAPSPQAFPWLLWFGTAVVGAVLCRLLFRRLFGRVGVLAKKRRHTTLLVGLPSSGKTALLSRLVTGDTTAETRTSMQVNTGVLHGHKEEERLGLLLVDYPGHRRLRDSLFSHLEEAVNVVVVIDSVTIQDDRHEGALAVSELLLAVLQSPEFYGVQKLLFACAKRDELASYSSKAVRKLLEAAMVRSIESRQGDLGRVDTVVDGKGTVVTGGGRKKHGGRQRAYVLDLGEEGGFSFDQLGLPVSFVDVSCYPKPAEHGFSDEPVIDFITGEAA